VVRLVSGVVLAVVAVAAILWLPSFMLRALVCVVALLAAHEFATVAGIQSQMSRALLSAAVVVTCWLASGGAFPRAEILVVAALAWVAVEVLFLGRAVSVAGAGLVAPVYIGIPLGMLAAVRELGGWRAAMLVLATVVVSDTAQYYSGRALGRRPLAPSISPKKTIEGALGGVVAGTLLMATAGRAVFPSSQPFVLVLLGAAVVVLGICGDLFESRLKRAANMKDSSSLIPGHGGVLDRVDALLFVAPAFYLFLRLSGGPTA
jgi:phosphatidate cytidylyltransferase